MIEGAINSSAFWVIYLRSWKSLFMLSHIIIYPLLLSLEQVISNMDDPL